MHTITDTVWLMSPDRVEELARRLARVTDWPTTEQLDTARQAQAKTIRRVQGKIGILPVQGVIEHRMSPIGYWFGSFSTELGEQALDSMLSAKEIEAIVLDVNSPGGTSYGVEEFSDRILAARDRKPIYAIANPMAASAAWWIASAAKVMLSTPSGDVGSQGVYAMHVDYSKAMEQDGVTVTIAKAGKYKAELSPYQPLTSDARDYMQELVDSTYTKFVRAVARNRGVQVAAARDNFGQGRIVSADAALSAGMIDRVMSFSDLLGKLSGGVPIESRRSANAEVLRLRQQLRRDQSSRIQASRRA